MVKNELFLFSIFPIVYIKINSFNNSSKQNNKLQNTTFGKRKINNKLS